MAIMGAGGGQGDDILSQVDAAIAGQITQTNKKSKNASGQPDLFGGLVHNVRDLIFGKNPNDPINRTVLGVQGTPIVPLPPVEASPLQDSKAVSPPELNNKGVDAAISGDAAKSDSNGFLKTVGKALGISL